MKFNEAKILIDYIEQDKINDFEKKFIQDICIRKSDLSHKQGKVLLNIYEKSSGATQYQRRQYI